MAVLLSTKSHTMQDWKAALLAVDPSLEIRLFPEAGDPAGIEAAVVWTAHDMMELRRYPNLRVIVSMGAGVDHLFRPPGPPPGVPVARLVDERLTQGMTEWVLLNVLRFHRQDLDYRAQQAAKVWHELPAPETSARRIGILGMGELGTDAARALLALGFPVMGWSRRPKDIAGVESFHGEDGPDGHGREGRHAGLPAAADAADARRARCAADRRDEARRLPDQRRARWSHGGG